MAFAARFPGSAALQPVLRVIQSNWADAYRNRCCPLSADSQASVEGCPEWHVKIIPVPPQGCAPLAQLDRASDYESEGREFESLRARHKINNLPSSWLQHKSLVCPKVHRLTMYVGKILCTRRIHSCSLYLRSSGKRPFLPGRTVHPPAVLALTILSNARPLERSPRPVCFCTPSHTYASPFVQRVRRKD